MFENIFTLYLNHAIRHKLRITIKISLAIHTLGFDLKTSLTISAFGFCLFIPFSYPTLTFFFFFCIVLFDCGESVN